MMSYFYDFHGSRHEISHDEVESIERSGRSEWRHYRDNPDDDEFHPTAWAKIAAMERRTGAMPIRETYDHAGERNLKEGTLSEYLHAQRFGKAADRDSFAPIVRMLGSKRLKVHVEGGGCPSMAKELVPKDMILGRNEFMNTHHSIQCATCVKLVTWRANVDSARMYVMSVKR